MIHKIILFVLCVVTASAYLCIDLDSTLCDMMLNRLPDACSDQCVAKFCKLSCKQCPLQCYDCSEVPDASNCTKITRCQDPSDYCFTAQTFTAHFTEAYRLGCGNRQTCLQYSRGHKRASLEAGCCNSDRCNNKPPSILKIEADKNYTGLASTQNPNICVNRDDDVCTRLTLLLGNPCIDDCIASKLCPHMCRKCFYCLDCYEVSNPSNCKQTTVCGHGKECYGLEKLGSDFTQVVQLGCIDHKLCEQLSSPSGHIFGKREFNFRGGCCIGDKCNAHPVSTLRKQEETTTTTLKPRTTQARCPTHLTHCPQGFYSYNFYRQHDCFLYGTQRMSKHQAAVYCKNHCAELLYINSTATNLNDLRFLQRYGNTEVFTDIERSMDGYWISSHDQTKVSNYITGVIHHSGTKTNDCVVAKVIRVHNEHGLYHLEQLNTKDCNSLLRPICKIRL